jgi:hypothetical protein
MGNQDLCGLDDLRRRIDMAPSRLRRFGVRVRNVACGVACALALAAAAVPASFAAERELEEEPAPSSVEEIEGLLEKAYPEPEVRPSLFPWIREKAEQLPPFLADTKLYLRYRTYYLRRDRPGGRLSEAWAMGGSVYYRSGWLKDFFAVELEGFTSQPIVAPGDRGGTLLLAPVQQGYAVLGVANGKLRYRDFSLTGFRQKLDLPYLNQRDNRMSPNTFEALKLAKQAGPVRFTLGYAWNFKERNSDRFVSLAERAGVSKDRGAAFGDILWYLREDLHVGASAFVVPDLLATVYAESGYEMSFGDAVGLRFDAQFTHQGTIGEELIAGSPFDTWNVGLRAATSWLGAVLRLGFAVTGDERRIESFYGSNPSYLGLMQRTFNQADEKALLVSLSYDFSGLGVEGLSAIANFAQGWDGVMAGERADAREFDFTVDYRIASGLLESFWLRLRASWLDDGPSRKDVTDFRVILRYELPVL